MVYNYTKPRRPITAMYSSPGPCYMLPQLVGRISHDPRSVHTRGPAYPIVGRTMKTDSSTGPGPCYYPSPGLLRTGRSTSPMFSLHSRIKGPSTELSPGPAQYRIPVNSVESGRPTPPAFTFGLRLRSKSFDQLPAPNTYNISGLVGNSRLVISNYAQSPSYSLPSRLTYNEDLKRNTPGPGTYSVPPLNKYKTQPPTVTMATRDHHQDLHLRRHHQHPGPAAYRMEDVWLHKNGQPKYSFGIKHSEYEANFVGRCGDADD